MNRESRSDLRKHLAAYHRNANLYIGAVWFCTCWACRAQRNENARLAKEKRGPK